METKKQEAKEKVRKGKAQSLTRLRKKRKTQIKKIRNERRNSPISPMYIEWIIMEYSDINIIIYKCNGI